MPNFKSAAKRKRELAKLDKRQAKEQRRALRKAERSAVDVVTATPATAVVAKQQVVPNLRATLEAVSGPKPLTFAEAVEKWKNTRVVKARKR